MPDEATEPTRSRAVVTPPEENLSLDDHRTYSQQLYGRPAWVLEGVFASEGFDPTKNHTVSSVKAALEKMLAAPDKRYEEKK